MATITEDYVSFETAKLLKEKGFDEETEHELWYVTKSFSTGCHWNYCTYKVGDITREYDEKYCIVMPTTQMAMKWLREVHNIVINIGWGEVFEDKFQWWCIILNHKDGSILRESEYYTTYEQACEAAIKYCLENLI